MNRHLFTVGMLAAATATGPLARAQDLEPRAYSNSPTGLNFLVAGYAYTGGSVLMDPSLPLDNVKVESDFAVFAYATTLNVLGKPAKFDLVAAYGNLSGHGDLNGQRRDRSVDGFTDPLLRFSMIFWGAPALTMAEFANYKQDLIFGGSLRVGVPLGQYDDSKIGNIGSNRWSIKPELGVSKAYGPWTLEVTPAVTFFTDNGDFFGGATREQSPLYSIQGSVSYSIRPGMWAALATTYFNGSRSTVDGRTNDDRQEGVRLGLTFALPISRYQSFKLYANTGFNRDGDNDFKAAGLMWQYRWGGGY